MAAPALDPVSIVIGVLSAHMPTVDAQSIAKAAWSVVNTLQALGTVQTTQATEGKG